eukprot:CAMPEP_0195298572 /NCGR_PEP_ID=MMETSP0707-20130614/23769_1 /TAXON_ID=33640 /ORGANISM="Asterionellopsis glacialis, Strain CCMP134" /LENGTH=567 /DNA_ID=CAMNT_0040360727 /DNA_START=233 /DNA_END=1932 /DNA_ORIENTATION=+
MFGRRRRAQHANIKPPLVEEEQPSSPLRHPAVHHKAAPSTPSTHASSTPSTKSPRPGHCKISVHTSAADSLADLAEGSTITRSRTTATATTGHGDDFLDEIQSQLRYLEREISKTRQTGHSVNKQVMMQRLSSVMKSLEQHNLHNNDDTTSGFDYETHDECDTDGGTSSQNGGFTDNFGGILGEDLLSKLETKIANPIDDFFTNLFEEDDDDDEEEDESDKEISLTKDDEEDWWKPQPWGEGGIIQPFWVTPNENPAVKGKEITSKSDSDSKVTPTPIPSTIDVAVDPEPELVPTPDSPATNLKSFWNRKKDVMAAQKSAARCTVPRVTGLSASTDSSPDALPTWAKKDLDNALDFWRPTWDDVSGTTEATYFKKKSTNRLHNNANVNEVEQQGGGDSEPLHHASTDNGDCQTPPRHRVKYWAKKSISCFSKPAQFDPFDLDAHVADNKRDAPTTKNPKRSVDSYSTQKEANDNRGNPKRYVDSYSTQKETNDNRDNPKRYVDSYPTQKETNRDTISYLSRSQPRSIYYGRSSARSMLHGEEEIEVSGQPHRSKGSPSRSARGSPSR